ncbi:MAG: 2-oxoacid:acceptor oxidoreductase family protein [Bacillota bacterium]|nr:2-oxoacid:acceptor oxidoreductase family protein [Bacillota bacterium]MDW7682714.1 2-oxoacid:acceptor oxidoreductase family protein [Bacillota bacterium]
MNSRLEFRFSGTGGQGLILAAIILAEAAMRDGHQVVQSQSYGPEARGGASKSEIILSQDKILYPKVTTPDFLLAMSDKAYQKYGKDFKDDGVLLADSTFIRDALDNNRKMVFLPLTKSAKEQIGTEIVANIVALGAVNAIMNAVTEESLKDAVLKRAPKGTGEKNLKALALGKSLVKDGYTAK